MVEERDKKLGEPQENAEVLPAEPVENGHKSRFPTWVRAIALLIVAVFIPEQVAWAIEYNPGILFSHVIQPVQPIVYVHGNPVTDLSNLQSGMVVAANVRRSLESLSYKTLNKVSLAENLEVTNPDEDGIFLTSTKINKIIDWLQDPDTKTINCGIQGLGYILKGYGVDTTIEELAILSILMDILSGAVNSFDGQLLTSLHSLTEVSWHFGIRLHPVEMPVNEDIFNLPIPFIVHIKNPEHFALVQKIEDDKVWLIKNNINKPFAMPKKKLLSQLSGYFLLNKEAVGARLLSEQESKQVKGAPGDWGGGGWDHYN